MSGTVHVSFDPSAGAGQQVRDVLSALGGLSGIIAPDDLVLIKPNFVAPFPHSATGFDVLDAVVREVRHCGGNPVIGESSGFEFDTEAAFEILGAYEFAERSGVQLVNLDRCDMVTIPLRAGPVKDIQVADIVQKAGVLINVPRLKGHSLTQVTFGMKNLLGLLHRDSRRRIHTLGLDRAIAAISRAIRSDVVIVDGSTAARRAVYGRQEPLGVIVAGTDVFAVDMYCCRLLGISHDRVGHLRHAVRQGMAGPKVRAVAVGEGGPPEPAPERKRGRKAALAAFLLRTAYQAMYAVDLMKCRAVGGGSIVPYVHFYLGVRPKLDRRRCTACGECMHVCPVNAVNMRKKKIEPALCMKIRCLRCLEVCPENAIELKGRDVRWNKTKLR